MDKDVARDIIRAAFRSGAELEVLLPILKQRCSEEDYKFFRHQVATALHGVSAALIDNVLSRFPELAAEIESNLRATGKAMP